MYRHNVGTTGPDPLIYEEKDEKFDVFTGKTRSKAYLFLFSGSHTTTEVRYIPANQPQADWKVLEPRKQDLEYYPTTAAILSTSVLTIRAAISGW